MPEDPKLLRNLEQDAAFYDLGPMQERIREYYELKSPRAGLLALAGEWCVGHLSPR